jgi:hypothetical protein
MQQRVACTFTIFAAGYEARATYAAANIPHVTARSYAIGFRDKQVLHYRDNVEWFKRSGKDVIVLDDPDFENWTRRFRSDLEALGSVPITIGIDISCFNRSRLASLINAIRTVESHASITTYFWYSLAKFAAPTGESGPNSHVGPVHPAFSGWFAQPELPPVAVVGLGYEQDKALGAVEHLEAASCWAFIPQSPEVEYLQHVYLANGALLESIPKSRQLLYEVRYAANCMSVLHSLISGLTEEANVVLLPFGPKMFALCCLLVASSDNRLAVWRVSSLEHETPMDRVPSGQLFGLQVDWGPFIAAKTTAQAELEGSW